MSVFSYFAYSQPGQKEQLAYRLRQWSECSVYPSDQEDLLILVTETSSRDHDEKLMKQIEDLPQLTCLAMVYGHGEEEVSA